jgi:hypothetical protein
MQIWNHDRLCIFFPFALHLTVTVISSAQRRLYQLLLLWLDYSHDLGLDSLPCLDLHESILYFPCKLVTMSDSPSSYLAQPPGSGSSQMPGQSKPTYSKRGKITIVACVPCRKRKTKCDGRRPTCSQCQTRDSPCQYDMNEEQRRLTFLRENVETLAEEKNFLEAFLWHLKTSNEDESSEILRRLRAGADPQSLLQQVQASRSLTQVKGDYNSFSINEAHSSTSCQY